MNPHQFELQNTGMFEALRKTANEQIAREDYMQQIDRWNDYQKLLDKVNEKTRIHSDVELRRNIKTNIKIWNERSLVLICCGMTMALSALVVGLMTQNFVVLAAGAAATIYFAREVYNRVLPPQYLTFKTSPKLHFDELATARNIVRGAPSAHKDPVVQLPVLYMKIPRRWFGQHGVIEFMNGLSNIDWDIRENMDREHRKYRNK